MTGDDSTEHIDSELLLLENSAESAENKNLTGWILIITAIILLIIGMAGGELIPAVIGLFLIMIGIGLCASARESKNIVAIRYQEREKQRDMEKDKGEESDRVAGEPGKPAVAIGATEKATSAATTESASANAAAAAAAPEPAGITGTVGVTAAAGEGGKTGVESKAETKQEEKPGEAKFREDYPDIDIVAKPEPETKPDTNLLISSEEFVPKIADKDEERDTHGVGVSGRIGMGLSESLGLEIDARVGIEFEERGGVRVEGGVGLSRPEKKGVTLEIMGKDAGKPDSGKKGKSKKDTGKKGKAKKETGKWEKAKKETGKWGKAKKETGERGKAKKHAKKSGNKSTKNK